MIIRSHDIACHIRGGISSDYSRSYDLWYIDLFLLYLSQFYITSHATLSMPDLFWYILVLLIVFMIPWCPLNKDTWSSIRNFLIFCFIFPDYIMKIVTSINPVNICNKNVCSYVSFCWCSVLWLRIFIFSFVDLFWYIIIKSNSDRNCDYLICRLLSSLMVMKCVRF